MKLYEIEFDPVWPVGGILVIQAESEQDAILKALRHFKKQDYPYMQKPDIVQGIREVIPDENGVIAYLSGDY